MYELWQTHTVAHVEGSVLIAAFVLSSAVVLHVTTGLLDLFGQAYDISAD